jgi:hypothetical protein
MFMASSHDKKGVCKSTLLFYFLIFVINHDSQAQNISKYYRSNLQEKGTLYYVLPMEGFINYQDNTKFIYDITCLNSVDSVTFNFSYFDSSLLKLDSLELTGSHFKTVVYLEKIFVDATKKQWHHRYTSRISLNDIKTFFKDNDLPIIWLQSKNKRVQLNIDNKKWIKQANIILKIIDLIQFNK